MATEGDSRRIYGPIVTRLQTVPIRVKEVFYLRHCCKLDQRQAFKTSAPLMAMAIIPIMKQHGDGLFRDLRGS